MLIGHFSFLVHLEVIEFECRIRLTSSKLFSWEQHLQGEHRQQETRGVEQPAASTWVPNWRPAFPQSVGSTCSLTCVTRSALRNDSFWVDISSLLQTAAATQLCHNMAKLSPSLEASRLHKAPDNVL